MRVALVIRALDVGGLERHLVNLAVGLNERGHRIAVLQLYEGSHFVPELEEAGIETATAGVRGRWDLDSFFRSGLLATGRSRPAVVHGFGIEANLLSLLAGRLSARGRVVWGVQGRNFVRRGQDRVARAGAWLHRTLSWAPALVLANSHQVRDDALAAGFPPQRVRVIANGVDIQRFQRDPPGRSRVRAEWGLGGDTPLIGIVARLSRAKNHELFLRAAASLAHRRDDVMFVCVGDGDPRISHRLRRLGDELGLGDRVYWAGARQDMPAVYSALDIGTLVSRAEGCPHAVCEAMACGVPCVVSDVGDTARVVGDAGVVLAPAPDPEAVAHGWERTLAHRESLTGLARARIEERYSRDRMVLETELALESVLHA